MFHKVLNELVCPVVPFSTFSSLGKSVGGDGAIEWTRQQTQ